MENRTITVNAIINDKILRKFLVFDNLYRWRRWVSPVIFASILSAFACVCFVMRGAAEQAVIIGCVLLLIGLGLPAVYIWSFFSSVKSQVKAYGLEKPRPVYSLRFSDGPDGVRVTNPGGEFAQYEWGSMYGAYRIAGCTYLYVAKHKAFLLPDGQADEGTDALWALFADMMSAEKLHDRRKIKG